MPREPASLRTQDRSSDASVVVQWYLPPEGLEMLSVTEITDAKAAIRGPSPRALAGWLTARQNFLEAAHQDPPNMLEDGKHRSTGCQTCHTHMISGEDLISETVRIRKQVPGLLWADKFEISLFGVEGCCALKHNQVYLENILGATCAFMELIETEIKKLRGGDESEEVIATLRCLVCQHVRLQLQKEVIEGLQVHVGEEVEFSILDG